MYYFTYALFLVSATITALTTKRYTIKIVHIIWTTISHFDVCWPITAATPVKTHRPVDLTICYCRVSTIHPAGCTCATSVLRWTWSWQSCTGGPLETIPTRSESTVTTVEKNVRNLSVTVVKTSVILTFWYRKKGNNYNYYYKNKFNFWKARKLFDILIFPHNVV